MPSRNIPKVNRRASLAARFVGSSLLSVAVGLNAQELLKPTDAVHLALERNAYLAASATRVAAAEGQRVQAGLKPNPRLFLQTENVRLPGDTPFRYSRDTDTFAYLGRTFETGGKRERRIDLASEDVLVEDLGLQLERTQLIGRVLNAYWNAAGAQRQADVLSESLDVLEQTVQYQRIRVEQGSLPEADLIRVELERQQVAIDHSNTAQEARRLLQSLFREIGIPPRPGSVLSQDIGAVEEIPPVDLDTAVEQRPDVRMAIQGVQRARALFRLQKANAVPDAEVLLGYKHTVGFNTLMAGVQIELPFKNRNRGAIASAAAGEAGAEAALQAVRTAARAEIETLLEEYQQKRELLEQILPTMRDQANETRRIAGAVYREGASDLLRLLDAERVRIQAETLYVQAVLGYRQSAINLQTALGQLP